MKQDDLLYSESARERVRKAGAAKLGEFIGVIPSRRVDPWLLSLPQIPGFRRKGKQAADEQRRRLIQRLTTSGKQNERDWQLFRQLWLTWIDDQVRDDGLRQVLEGGEHGPEADGNVPLVERVREELARIADAGTVSSETLETLLSFGPFDDTSELYAAMKAAPRDRDIERDKYVSTLPKQLAEIDRRIREALETAQARDQGAASDALAIANQLTEVTQLLSSLSTQVGSLVQWQEAAAKMLEEDSRRGAEWESRLKVIEESFSPQETSEDSLSSATKVDEILDKLLGVLDRLEGLEAQVATLGKSTAELNCLESLETQLANRREPSEAGEAEGRLIEHRAVPSGLVLRRFESSADTGSVEITKPRDLATHLGRQFNASGLLDRDASILACEVTGALLASQIVSVTGSSSSEILRALVNGLGGTWNIGSVPVGVFDDACLRRWKEGSDGRGQLALENINSSAFEVYGTPIREAVVRAQIRRVANELVVCGTLMDGHGGLPIIVSYSELGPIINTDSLVWRSNTRPEDGQAATLRVRMAKDAVPHDAGENVTELIAEALDAVGVTPSVVFSAGVRNAAAVLAQLSKSDADILESLLASWLFPYFLATGLQANAIVEKLSSTALGEVATSVRLGRLVSLDARP